MLDRSHMVRLQMLAGTLDTDQDFFCTSQQKMGTTLEK